MSYDYKTQRPWLFTEQGADAVLRVRDNALRLIKQAGAVRAAEAWKGAAGGDSWNLLAILDYLVERGDLREVSSDGTAGQYRVFIGATL